MAQDGSGLGGGRDGGRGLGLSHFARFIHPFNQVLSKRQNFLTLLSILQYHTYYI